MIVNMNDDLVYHEEEEEESDEENDYEDDFEVCCLVTVFRNSIFQKIEA